jgi:mannonate dehydratase
MRKGAGDLRLAVVEKSLAGDRLDYLRAIGVRHLCSDDVRGNGFERTGFWDAAQLENARKHVEAHGLTLDMVTLPLNAVDVDRVALPGIILANENRDRDIERFIRCMRAAKQAGIPAVKYNFTIGGVLRTAPQESRAGAMHTALDYGTFEFKPTAAGEIAADEMWSRIQYLLDRIMPVARELDLRVSLHPHDPAMPLGAGMDDRVLGTLDGLRRYLGMADDPLFGLTFCQGCMAESGATTGELVEAIREFGRRIFMIHFRTIVGGYLHFREAFVDEGDIDMLETMKAYQATCPAYTLLVPDHYPKIPGDSEWGHQTRAYAVGYIKALMRATGGETD